jgi:hypothetical protein
MRFKLKSVWPWPLLLALFVAAEILGGQFLFEERNRVGLLTSAPTATPGLGDITLGKEGAPMSAIVFLSPSCRFCQKWVEETLPDIEKKLINTGRLRIIIRLLPSDLGEKESADDVAFISALACRPEDERLAALKFAMRTGQEVRKDLNDLADSNSPLLKDCNIRQTRLDVAALADKERDALGNIPVPSAVLGRVLIPGGLSELSFERFLNTTH